MSDLSNQHTAATTTIEEANSLSQAFLAVAGALRGSGQPDAVFAVLERLYRQRVGFKMLTFMTTDREARIGRRVFTTSPETHPVGADKPVTESDWVEMGGAGMFRPEVTEPLGCTSPVLAWGLGLERLAMFTYDLSSIGELYRARLSWLKGVDLCRL